MMNETIAYGNLKPNNYNPNKMDALQYAAELESIQTFGFIDPITVRLVPNVAELREIIDGEHRWKAFGEVRIKWLAGEFSPPDEIEPFILPCLQDNSLPVFNLGIVSDVHAKKLTLILNETRGRASQIDVATLLAQIASETSAQEARVGLPYSEGEVEEMIKLAAFDWSAAQNHGAGQNVSQGDNPGDEAAPVEPFVTLTALLPQSAHVVWMEACEKVKAMLAAESLTLNADAGIGNGQVLEALCAEYLASP